MISVHQKTERQDRQATEWEIFTIHATNHRIVSAYIKNSYKSIEKYQTTQFSKVNRSLK